MPKDFIKEKINSSNIYDAVKQQEQLSYFTESKIQGNVNEEYIKGFIQRNYSSNDYFLNWLKTILKTDNFLLIFKYLRFPLPSTELINDNIKNQLKRVFYAEDSLFRYEIDGKVVVTPKDLEVEEFNNMVFNALLFNHNNIIVEDLKDVNKPYRYMVDIDKVISIDSKNSVISRIAYYADAMINGEMISGILYIDDKQYIFYNKDFELGEPLLVAPHDLGRCPADYISMDAFSSDNDIVRKSIFSYTRELIENYVFLTALQRMSEAGGVIPTITMLDIPIVKDIVNNDNDDLEPMSLKQIGGQQSSEFANINNADNVFQSGNLIKVTLVRDELGKPDMDVVKNYLNFFYIPIEALKYLNSRISEVENKIISNIIGSNSDNGLPIGSKSSVEINKITIASRQDKLREFSKQLSRIRRRSDYNLLSLKYGKPKVKVDIEYGTDFFLDSQETIYSLINLSPNPIEQKSLLLKSARNRNRFNEDAFTRDYILYQLLPYSMNKDFEVALENNFVENDIFQYQTRFNYWISMFEAIYGDILAFWNKAIEYDSNNNLSKNEKESKTINEINKLILTIIRENYEKSSASKNLQGN